ncbi:MAG: porphobilinogen synthase [Candidatus Caenarcaniphilales bacterium]|nr:porphobilinogen synthase [Candidatus Caenarcaniphilales bacterium]
MKFASFPFNRPRRLRKTQIIRDLVQETHFSVNNLIAPLFILDGENIKQEINSMPGVFRYSLDLLMKEVGELIKLGVNNFALFPVINKALKNQTAEEALNPFGLIPQAIKTIKKSFPQAILISDIALDPFTSHGHDGLVNEFHEVVNDKTVEILCKMAVCHAEAGVDVVAPSDMMDGRISKIRGALDSGGFSDTLIMSYSAKFASSFYGPFRDALSSNLVFGDKKSYQLNPANALEAEKEIEIDALEGADMLMVKPGLSYLDIVYRAKQITKLPVIAYSVSGEYSMIKAASQNQWLNEKEVVFENMIAFRRAGASGVITYHARQIAEWLSS